MASTSSSSQPEKVPETRSRRRTKRAQFNDESRSEAVSTIPAPTGYSSWRGWASLACGPATVIAERVLSADVADYIRFRAVCSAWRRCTADPHGDALDRWFHPYRWTMIHVIQRRGARQYCRFLNFSTGESIRMTIRGVDGRTPFVCTSQGLHVLLNMKTDGVCVLNPITGAHADLPPVTRLLSGHLRDLLLPRWPDGIHVEVTDDLVVVICFGEQRLLGVARPGDEHWAKVECQHRISSLFSSAGRVYSFSRKTVMVLETSPDQTPRLVKAPLT
ncbi:hypothetical protein ACQ4PT_062241 [Festuca glaucescens]